MCDEYTGYWHVKLKHDQAIVARLKCLRRFKASRPRKRNMCECDGKQTQTTMLLGSLPITTQDLYSLTLQMDCDPVP